MTYRLNSQDVETACCEVRGQKIVELSIPELFQRLQTLHRIKQGEGR